MSFCDTTKCFANYFSFLCTFLRFLIDGRWFGLLLGVIILVLGERENGGVETPPHKEPKETGIIF